MLRHIFYIFIFAILSVVGQARAQTFQEPKDIEVNPHLYPAMTERRQVLDWVTNPENHAVKIYSQEEFNAHTLDDRVQIEGYGHYIVYRENYLRWTEIQAYEARKAQIVPRSYNQYKNYLIHHNITHYYELFGN